MSEEAVKVYPVIDDTYQSIRAILEKARSTTYRAVNFAMVQAYWEIGRVIVGEEQRGSERAKYGKALIKELSRRLIQDYGKGFNQTNLWYMRQFYLTFKNPHALRGDLTWTHYRLLLKVDKEEARDYYMIESIENRWSTRELERQINSLLYERLALSKDREKVLEFYNYVLKCFVLIDLKVGKLTHQDIGQMDFYARYFEKEEKLDGDNPTIGLILCSDKNETMVKYTLLEDSKQIFASKYKLYLPTEDELKKELEREREMLEMEKRLGGK